MSSLDESGSPVTCSGEEVTIRFVPMSPLIDAPPPSSISRRRSAIVLVLIRGRRRVS